MTSDNTAVAVPGWDREDLANANKTEIRYAERLTSLMLAGEIQFWDFEAVKLRLSVNGGKCFYTPDFLVINRSGEVEFHEVKGFWRDDARVKIKTARRIFPFFRFKAVQWKKKAWIEETF